MPADLTGRNTALAAILTAAVSAAGIACGSSSSSGTASVDVAADAAVDLDAAGVRTCGRNLTVAAPTKVTVVVPTFGHVALGQGVDASGALISATYATGTLDQPNGSDSNDVTELFSHATSVAIAIAYRGATPLIVVPDGGTSAVADINAQFTASPTRLVDATTFVESAGDFGLMNQVTSASTPAGSSAVFDLAPTTVSVYAFKLDFPDACAIGALDDVLGGDAADATPKLVDIITAAATNPAVSQVLVREGVTATVEILTNVQRPTLSALVPGGTTTCGTANLAACGDLSTSVVDAINTYENSRALPTLQTFAAIQAGTDPEWSFTSFSAAAL